MSKRIVTRIGNVFCAEIDGEFKCYFQYICNDLTQLNSSVIRVFTTRYPLDYTPVIEDIVRDSVLFYTHTVLRWGIELGGWYKVGTSQNTDVDKLNRIFWTNCREMMKVPVIKPTLLWNIWRVNRPMRKIIYGINLIPGHVELGSIMSYTQVNTRMKYGYYTASKVEFNVLRRKPRNDVDSYLKCINSEDTTFYHYRGDNIVRQLIVCDDKVFRLDSQNTVIEDRCLRMGKFSATNWAHDEFISELEFRKAWSKN